ncbi:MAG: ribonuclease Z [Saprospiraceae bacterium]|nr:ribonuclease Z [Saprospiraceae bacterium]
MRFSLTLLGTSSAMPVPGRFTSAQVLNVQEHLYLIDCGEGMQMRMSDFGVKRSKINQIFISHLHGDHFFGLMGLLTSYGLNDRRQPLEIFSPAGLEEMIRVLTLPHGEGEFQFKLIFNVLDTEKHQLVFEDKIVRVYSIPLKHRIPTSGFLFVEKERPRSILPEKIEQYQIPYQKIPAIKRGADFILPSGKIIPNEELTTPSPKPRSYAYCSDTMYKEDILPMIQNVDLLYHEATFLQKDYANALETMHATAAEAATIAQKANAEKLIIAHYSTRYKNINELVTEAQAIFPNTIGGEDGMTIEVPFRK